MTKERQKEAGGSMGIVVKNIDLSLIVSALREVLASRDIDVRFLSWAGKLVPEIDALFRIRENIRMGLINKYGMKDDKGHVVVVNNQFDLPPENQVAFAKEFAELEAIEHTIAGQKYKIFLSEIPKGVVSGFGLMGLEKIAEVVIEDHKPHTRKH
jgi:hypothetical protein